MRYVNIFVGEEGTAIKFRKKKFPIGSPLYVGISSRGKEVIFRYNINDIPSEIKLKLKEFTEYISAEGSFSSQEMVYPLTGNDVYSIKIPAKYKFRIENIHIKNKKCKIKLKKR